MCVPCAAGARLGPMCVYVCVWLGPICVCVCVCACAWLGPMCVCVAGSHVCVCVCVHPHACVHVCACCGITGHSYPWSVQCPWAQTPASGEVYQGHQLPSKVHCQLPSGPPYCGYTVAACVPGIHPNRSPRSIVPSCVSSDHCLPIVSSMTSVIGQQLNSWKT